MKYFRMYSLRKSVIFEHLDSSKISIVAINTKIPVKHKEGYIIKEFQEELPKAEVENYPGEEFTETLLVGDPRTITMGFRMYSPTQFIKDYIEFDINKGRLYTYYKYVNGIAEGTEQLSNQLPLNLHMHLMNAIDFNKGCYLGHELTQRTFQTGVLRKVVLPFLISQSGKINTEENENFDPLENLDLEFKFKENTLAGNFILTPEGKRVGRVVGHKHNLGIGLFSLNKLEDQYHSIQHKEVDDLDCLIWTPNWLKRLIPKKNNIDKENGRELTINPKVQYETLRGIV
mmetsp:Transcript_27493/g.24374  ORF Transcript_27493/g.24374 Transcript_27493/m.24374 type:complete len:287 (-) Transcript_27493:27-887(-)